MKYINSDCGIQDQPVDLDFLLRDDTLVNTVRYQMEYINMRGIRRNFDIYIPQEVFLDIPVPDQVFLRIGVEL